MEHRIFKFPKWVTAFYIVAGIILIPWTYGLAQSLPDRQIAENWAIAWVGLDIFMLVLIGLTVIFAIRRSVWLALSATALATVLILDSWFDVVTASPGQQQVIALVLAMTVGLPMAILTYMLAHRSISALHNKIEHKR